MDDGRASVREIAARTSLSAPTVSLHLSRMEKGGLIRGFEPIIDPSAAQQVEAFVKARVPADRLTRVAENLSRLREVAGVFLTSGSANLTVRIKAQDNAELQRFVEQRVAKHAEGGVVTTEIVTKAVKDSRGALLSRKSLLHLKCDYCHGDITSDRPYNIRVGSTYHYFCCRTCRKSFISERTPLGTGLRTK